VYRRVASSSGTPHELGLITLVVTAQTLRLHRLRLSRAPSGCCRRPTRSESIATPILILNELSPVHLPLVPCYLADQALHRHSSKHRALSNLLSVILPDRIALRIRGGIPSTPLDGPSWLSLRSTHHLHTSNVLRWLVHSFNKRSSYALFL
jgi:hypothetical protein